MKILTITNLYPPHGIGGYEERCRQVMEGLRDRGHQVHVLTSNHGIDSPEPVAPPPNPIDPGDARHPAIYRQLRIHGFYGHPWLPIHQLYHLEKHNQTMLREALGRIEPDIIHVWNMGGISKSLLVTLENHALPLVYDVSDHWIARSLKADVWQSWWNEPRGAFTRVARFLAGATGSATKWGRQVPIEGRKSLRFRHIYFCSKFLRDLTANAGYPVGHGSVIYCGVEVDKFARKSHYSAPNSLLWVGRLAEDKDPLTAVRGLALALVEAPGLKLDLYGRGEPAYTHQLEQEIQRLGLGDRVRLCSASHSEMKNIYSRYDALLFTSNWGEPFALTPLEAMAAGLPVIMCPDGGDAELAENQRNCLTFTAGQPADLSRAIRRFTELPDHGKQLAQTAHAQVRENFDMPVIVDQIEQFLSRALESRPA